MTLPPDDLPRLKNRSLPARVAAAFSLVEVVLALGITATALLVIFSLMPLGLSSLQNSQRQIVETEIYNKIGSELGTTPLYADPVTDPDRSSVLLDDYCSKRFPAYFDAEGNELPSTRSVQAVFTVVCQKSREPGRTIWSPSIPKGELLLATVMIGFHRSPTDAAIPADALRQRTFLFSNHGN